MIPPSSLNQWNLYKTPETSPGYLLWRTSTTWRKLIELALKPTKLTHPQFVVLASIDWLSKGDQKASQADVGRHAGLDPNTISQILGGLQTKKLVERISSNNERSKFHRLTQEGKERLSQAIPLIEKTDQDFFAILAQDEEIFLKLLGKLTYNSDNSIK
ncbi:MAG: MarR family winged helix-turn-helix transcriptional regulator [Alphaproteobacteria bacterium]|nr:MarR family winged helix-turn-helix transcriptional regulator [Alphaproteobacteria bacterium]